MARTGVLLAPKQQLPPQMARNRHASACSVAGAKSATPTACVTSAEMALGLRQTSHSAGHWRFLPPFFFCGCWCKFFFNAPLFDEGTATFCAGARGSKQNAALASVLSVLLPRSLSAELVLVSIFLRCSNSMCMLLPKNSFSESSGVFRWKSLCLRSFPFVFFLVFSVH